MKPSDRTAIALKAEQPFLEWLHGLDSASGDYRLANLHVESTIYLLPGRSRVRPSWPRRRDLETFERWFEWSFRSAVMGACEGRVVREEG